MKPPAQPPSKPSASAPACTPAWPTQTRPHSAAAARRLAETIVALIRAWPGDQAREQQLEAHGGASRHPQCGVPPHMPSPSQPKENSPVKQPKDRDPDRPHGSRPPEYVVQLWVSQQLRDRIQGLGPSLAEALEIGHAREADPAADREELELADREPEP